ncbi:hypothetical protein [Collimonas antrihumi]|uniref:hypothetical protein n=1 Tax=Collimonas antrihumi TaxID=1940615 RepID=UPI001B8B394F|nr:hypothetical protein [Collimonas antrihumi]
MAKTTNATPDIVATTDVTPVAKTPRLGEIISVRAGADRTVPNNEAGDYFSEKDAVAVTVDLRILKLLRDGDLLPATGKK